MNYKVLALFGIVLLGAFGVVCPVAFADTAGDMTATIQDWLPVIIEFAMLGMMMGFIRKFTRNR